MDWAAYAASAAGGIAAGGPVLRPCAASGPALVNSAQVEAVAAHLLRARDNRSARQLAGAEWVLRRKRDGGYLGCVQRDGDAAWLIPVHGALAARDEGVDALLAALGLQRAATHAQVRSRTTLRRLQRATSDPSASMPLHGLALRLQELGVDARDYGERHQLALVPEPRALASAGRDRYRRPLFLLAPAARAWRTMQSAASAQGVALQAISGYRSHDYQLGILRRKLARGQSLHAILKVNTAPGYSEHHSGRALDIATPGEPAAEESFEATPAFTWLQHNAAAYGFRLSYPRGNPHGIVHEPWHWCWHPNVAALHAA